MIDLSKKPLKNSSLIFERRNDREPTYVLAVPEVVNSANVATPESTKYLFGDFRTPYMEYKIHKVIHSSEYQCHPIPVKRLYGRAKKLYNRHHLTILTYNLIKEYEQ